MKIRKVLVLVALTTTAGFVAACSSDGTGTVPAGAYGGGGTTGQFGGAIGTTNDSSGALVGGGTDNSGSTSPGGATGTAGSPMGGSSPAPAGTTAITTTPSGGSPAAGGTSAGGSATSAGGTSTGTGGTTSAGGTGGSASTGADTWWPSAFDANATPSPSNGKHNPGKACLTCHYTGGQGPAWLFGGTVFDKTESSGVAHVQVGIKEGGKFFSAYSANNGNIWLPMGSSAVTWANAEIRVRTATGEKKMMSFPLNGDCNNSCHVPGNRTQAP